jgi:hypothetical protein
MQSKERNVQITHIASNMTNLQLRTRFPAPSIERSAETKHLLSDEG